eukprot:TRINITY_DN16260_c0_g1_i1.p1 TRINITY_DN16260_c0_g1~~TRINITY_DN16260_c0_g1_i1.p1  ORF type:complete len:163 (-),score=29.42 TRINITY_DN16260_c0_g1_i1:23-511(-)
MYRLCCVGRNSTTTRNVSAGITTVQQYRMKTFDARELQTQNLSLDDIDPNDERFSQSKNPNLGFHPLLFVGKGFEKHDHPERPSSVYIAQVPPVVVEERVAVCDGGSLFGGHPRVYICLDHSTADDPTPCGYCGIRFVQKQYIPPDHPLLKSSEKHQDDDHH